jgi:hypothetical protein
VQRFGAAGCSQPGEDVVPDLTGEAAGIEQVLDGFHLLVAVQAAWVVLEASAPKATRVMAFFFVMGIDACFRLHNTILLLLSIEFITSTI